MDSDSSLSVTRAATITGADILVSAAVQLGVDTCFANPGTTEMALVAALDRAPGIRPVLGLFEGVCSGAADGYGRVTGRPAMTLLHLGPGLGNALANLHNAHRAYTPIINVVGEQASWHRDFDAALTSDIESLARPVSRWVRSSRSASALGTDLEDACHAAISGRGPSTLIVPADLQLNTVANNEARGLDSNLDRTGYRAVADERITDAAKAIRNSRSRIVILLGGNALDTAGQEAAWRLSTSFGATLYCETFPAIAERGVTLPDLDRLPYFPEIAIRALADADVVLLAGAKEPVAYFGYAGMPSLLAPPGAVVPLAGPIDDASAALVALAELLGCERTPLPHRARPAATGDGPLTGTSVGQVVAGLLPEGAIVSIEGGTCGYPFFTAAAGSAPHSVLTNTGGAIGQGLPAALGAAIAAPDRPVLAIQSDGSAQYTVQALWTMARERCDVTVLIAANHTYNVLRTELGRHGTTEYGPAATALTELSDPRIDWLALARGYGVDATRVESTAQLSGALAGALGTSGPHLIEMAL